MDTSVTCKSLFGETGIVSNVSSSLFLMALLLALSFTITAQNSIIYVSPGGGGNGSSLANPTDFQSALDAVHGKTDTVSIQLMEGTYDVPEGSYSFKLQENETVYLEIRGGLKEDGSFSEDPQNTILNGQGLRQILKLSAQASGGKLFVFIRGLSFKNGYAKDDNNSETFDHGAALSAYEGTADLHGQLMMEIAYCDFMENKTVGNINGGAIYTNSIFRIHRCLFERNDASNGGAIMATTGAVTDQSRECRVEECIFKENKNFGNQGSSIWHNLTLEIFRCEFHGMDDGSLVGNGSCVWGNQGSTHRITACLFKNIKVKYWGSAIQSFAGNAYIANCIFTGNKAGEESGTGDGYGTIAFYHDNKEPTIKRITNCTFVNNRSRFPGSSSGGAIHNRGRTGDDFIVTNCLVYNNGQYPLYTQGPATVRYSFIPSSNYGFTDGGHNFVGEPMFADDDFHLSEVSPCINAGLNDPEPFMERDYEGNRRLLNGYMDVGAFEYNRTPGNLSISDTVINENTAAGVALLSFSATDPDPEDEADLNFELAVPDDFLITDNDKFRIEGNQLFMEENPNFEEQNLYLIVVTAFDMGGLSTSKSFRIHVKDMNDPVIANGTIPGQTVLAGETFSYSFASDLFTDEDVGDVLSYSATLSNDTPLPSWLVFDGGTRAFSGSPVNSDAGTMQVKITASDGNGSAASVTFSLEVQYNTALNEIEEDGFKLYPNPATDLLMLEFAERYGGQILRIYNCLGILEKELMLQSTGRASISISDLPAGIYFLRIGDSGKHTRKFRVK